MSRPLGPGPGAYLLPPTVGFDKHDARKNRLPQYSFGLRTGMASKALGPGPGAYAVDKVTRYGVSRANEFTMAPRTTIPVKQIGPGPGAHEVHIKPFFKGVNAPAYTMKWRTTVDYKKNVPAPNAYSVSVTPIKPGVAAFSMGIRTNTANKMGSPGPAAYGLGNASNTKPRPPEYSIAGRQMLGLKRIGPGPNNYDLMYYRPGRSGQAYSFGTKHHPYAPPMVVKCDNM